MEDLIMTMKRILCSSLAVVCVASAFVGCSAKKEKKDDFIGKWECEKIVMGGEETDNFFGVDAYALYQIELKEGNKGTVDSLFNNDGEVIDIEWKKQKDGKVKIAKNDAFDGEEAILEKDGGKLLMSMVYDEEEEVSEDEEVKMYFVKVDEFKEMPENPFGDLSSDDDSDFSFDDEDEDATAEEAE